MSTNNSAMSIFHNILVCLDITETDHFLISYTNFIVNTFKPKRLVFLHVMESYELPDEIMDSYHDNNEKLEELISNELQERIEDDLSVKDKIDFDLVIEEGLPTEKISQYAKRHDIDLTILSGKGGVSKKLAGALPSSVLYLNEKSRHQIKKLLVKMDFSKLAALALRMAQSIANRTGATVECLHVYKFPLNYLPKVTPGNVKDMKGRLREYVGKEYSKFLEKEDIKDAPPCSYSMELQDDEGKLINNYAFKNDVDMIVTASKYKSPLANFFFEESSKKLLGEGKKVPVLVVKNGEDN